MFSRTQIPTAKLNLALSTQFLKCLSNFDKNATVTTSFTVYLLSAERPPTEFASVRYCPSKHLIIRLVYRSQTQASNKHFFATAALQ